jgi:hypothetical protein
MALSLGSNHQIYHRTKDNTHTIKCRFLMSFLFLFLSGATDPVVRHKPTKVKAERVYSMTTYA